jgi:hypothetical protein
MIDPLPLVASLELFPSNCVPHPTFSAAAFANCTMNGATNADGEYCDESHEHSNQWLSGSFAMDCSHVACLIPASHVVGGDFVISLAFQLEDSC